MQAWERLSDSGRAGQPHLTPRMMDKEVVEDVVGSNWSSRDISVGEPKPHSLPLKKGHQADI